LGQPGGIDSGTSTDIDDHRRWWSGVAFEYLQSPQELQSVFVDQAVGFVVDLVVGNDFGMWAGHLSHAT
jgi:hypothetical protein